MVHFLHSELGKVVSFCARFFFCVDFPEGLATFREGESGSGRQRQDMEPLGCGLRIFEL